MPILDLNLDAVRRLGKGLYQVGLIYGYIGVLQSDGTYQFTKRSDNTVSVTLDDGTIHYAVVAGINSIVGGKRVAMREINNRLVIQSGDTNADLSERQADIIPTTIRGTGAEQIVETMLINEGLVRQQSNSLTVVVFPLTYPALDGSITRRESYAYVNLTSSVPGTVNQRRYAVIVQNRSDGTVSVVNGATKTSALLASDIEAASLLCAPHEIPLAFVDIRNGDTTVYWDRIVEARQFAPGLNLPVRVTVTSATYTITDRDMHIFCNRAGTVGLTLPAASDAQYGTELTVKDISGGAGSNTITITRAGSDTIDGATNVTITTNYGYVKLIAHSSGAWSVVG